MKRPIIGHTIAEQPADTVLTMLAWGEARNQKAVGILAVLCVVMNRAYDKMDHNEYQADPEAAKLKALAPLQFSCFNKKDPNRALMLDAWKTDPYNWGRCWTVVELVINGACADVTNGSDHYFTSAKPVWAANWPPKWGLPEHGFQQMAVIGDHVFGKAP